MARPAQDKDIGLGIRGRVDVMRRIELQRIGSLQVHVQVLD
jgi:hypothetical protein